MNSAEKKLYIESLEDLVQKYESSNKPEKFIDTLTNYQKHSLRVAIGMKENFPTTWKEKIEEQL